MQGIFSQDREILCHFPDNFGFKSLQQNLTALPEKAESRVE